MTGSPLWPREDVLPRRHAVLGGISPGYPSVTARLHTCYSPVRRSPAATSKLAAPLPLDLHVLSLSLAFILSQDQTLRCLNCFIILAPESVIVVQSHTSLTVSIRKISSPILVLLVELCKSLKELFCRFRFANVAAKIRTFILNLQIISELFFLKVCFIILYRRSLSNAGAKVML